MDTFNYIPITGTIFCYQACCWIRGT